MGQYFRAINTDKQEYICPWCLDGGAKLWEWSANPKGAIFTLLLRRSSSTGGGDYGGQGTQIIELDNVDNIGDVLAKTMAREGQDMPIPEEHVVGRWAGDCVYLIGDYDESGLYDESRAYRNISRELVTAWNQFIEIDDHQLTYTPCGCGETSEPSASG